MSSGTLVSRLSSKNVIYAAIAGDLLIGVAKFTAAAATGSSAMFSEGMHSFADTGNGLLVLYGLHRAGARPDRDHPFGYGREIYFWSFIVAVLLFALGAGASLYQGISHLVSPEPVQHVAANYLILGLSAVFDGTTWWLALRNFRGKLPYSELLTAVHNSKDPPSFLVLFEDSAALIGLLFAFAGIYLSVKLDLPVLDSVGSILVGLVLAVTAFLVARETKSLLIGERADDAIVDSILEIANGMHGVAHANGVLTVHLAPRQIVAALSLEFADELTVPIIEAKVLELEQRVRRTHPDVVAVFIKPQSQTGFKDAAQRRFESFTDPG